MNTEFLFLFSDYFRILNRRDAILEWGVSFAIGAVMSYLNSKNAGIAELLKSVSGNSITLLGILIGFSVAVITLLTTASSSNIDDIKKHETKYRIGTQKLSLYNTLLIHYSYSVVVEVLLVISNLIFLCLSCRIKTQVTLNIINSIDIFLISHVLFLTLRNISNFYFILMKNEKLSNKA